MTLLEKLYVYDIMLTNYAVDDRVPINSLETFLRSHGVVPAVYGYQKMKEMLEDMPEICSLSSEQLRDGITEIWYATILPRPSVDTAAEEPANRCDELPEIMDNSQIFFHYDNQNRLAKYLTGKIGTRLTSVQLNQFKTDYETARKDGTLKYDSAHNSFSFTLSTPSYTGAQLLASISRSNHVGGCPWLVSFIGIDMASARSTKPGEALKNFAFLGNMGVFLRSLAEHVQEEPWNFHGASDDFSILQQYIFYTFYRLQQQDKICIAEDGSFAAFNTGLQSRRLGEDVFAYFVPNESNMGSAWKFVCFCSTDSRDTDERRCYKTMYSVFKEPEPASYFSKISDLLFDPACDVQLSSDHIFMDNCNRLPMDFLKRECAFNDEASALLDEINSCTNSARRNELYKQLGGVITDDPDLFTAMNERFQGALDRTIKRIRRNYKLAVPCFFPTRNVMSMMLPISFSATAAPSVVLVCERTLNGDYIGQTILTLPMAYIDSRLLCRPGSEWLNTNDIFSNETPEVFAQE